MSKSNDKTVQILVKLKEELNAKLSDLLATEMKGALSKAKAIDLIVKDFLEQDSIYQSSVLRELGSSNFYSLFVDYTFGLAQGDHYFNSNKFLDCVDIYENLYQLTNSESDILSDKIKLWCEYRLSYVFSSLGIEFRKTAIQNESPDYMNYSLNCINESVKYSVQLMNGIKTFHDRFNAINLFNMACILSLRAQFSAENVFLKKELPYPNNFTISSLNPESAFDGDVSTSIELFKEIEKSKHSSLNHILSDCEQSLYSLRKLITVPQEMAGSGAMDKLNHGGSSSIMYSVLGFVENDPELAFLKSMDRFKQSFSEICQSTQNNWGSIDDWLKKRYG